MNQIIKTAQQYREQLAACKAVFVDKNKDYGTAWRILRSSSLTDQIFIKASRIRTIQEKQLMKIEEGIEQEFLGIVNYSIIALIQLDLGRSDSVEMASDQAISMFDEKAKIAQQLMGNKNHDYGEAWRSMRVSSITDLILMKILRIKQIENNDGNTIISEGIEANFLDMINYAIFALILLTEKSK